MRYSMIHPPANRPFAELTREEAKAYFDWYIAQIPQRIVILEQAVQSSEKPEYQSWVANKFPESLYVLGQWFAEHVTTQPVTGEQKERRAMALEKVPAQYRAMLSREWPSWILTPETFSLIMDIGMYLGEVLRTRLPYLKWQLCTTKLRPRKKDGQLIRPRHVNYHEPVLAGFKKGIVCSPEAGVHVLALRIVEKSKGPSGLYEVLDSWVYRETEW